MARALAAAAIALQPVVRIGHADPAVAMQVSANALGGDDASAAGTTTASLGDA